MKTINLEDIPAPGVTGASMRGTALVFNEELKLKVLTKLDKLGWVWCGAGGEKIFNYSPPIHHFNIGLYELNICYYPVGYKNWFENWEEFKVIDIMSSKNPINLKAANTSSLATNCASCGGKLKDPGMGPIYKHCPKCEP
jgi:hypothetical protein